MVPATDPNYDPVQDPGNPKTESSLKDPAFWVNIAKIIFGALLEAGVIGGDSVAVKVIGAVFAVIGALGITAKSTAVTLGGQKQAANVAISKVESAAAQKIGEAAASVPPSAS